MMQRQNDMLKNFDNIHKQMFSGFGMSDPFANDPFFSDSFGSFGRADQMMKKMEDQMRNMVRASDLGEGQFIKQTVHT
jgi:hypothetical protein